MRLEPNLKPQDHIAKKKGVQLGRHTWNCLENLIKNPSLADLIGIQYVTLSDDEAKRRGTQKYS
jgi:stage III sporulation protein SpoIIIAA